MTFRLITIFLVLSFSSPVFSGDMLLRLHGSNTIGAELAPALVKGWLGSQGYKDIRLQNLRENEVVITAVDLRGVKQAVEIHSHGSSTAFKSLKRGQADIGMASRPIKQKEINQLKDMGDMTRLNAEYVIGLDGIAVIINASNPIRQLDKEVIRKIFSGEYTQWNQVDRNLVGEIHVYARDDKSGTFDTFKALVLGKESKLASSATRYESNAHLSDDVAKDLLGIGFVGLPYVRDSKSIAVSEKGTIARKPKAFEVATEDYALARRLYMYIPNQAENETAASFITYAMSVEGQHIVDQTGFVSQNVKAHTIEVAHGFPDEYIKMTRDSQRLSINFRFKKGSTSLDNKALHDVERLVDYMSRPENRSKRVMLFGFAESSESLPVFSLDLSTYRVDWVSDLLIQNGIDPVRVRAYGDAIPVVSNEDAGGRHKNRRVEVWLQ